MADLPLDDTIYVGLDLHLSRFTDVDADAVLTCSLEHLTMGLQVVSRFSNSNSLLF